LLQALKPAELNARNKRIFSLIIKISILVLAFWFIVNKLTNNNDLNDFQKLIQNLSPESVYGTLSIVFLFMLLNWFLEALKWKFLVRPIQRISTWKAVQSVFCGLTIAVFTPNRIGEYGGRVFFLAPRKRVFGIAAMAVGAIGQMVITNILGALAIVWFVWKFMEIGFWLNQALFFIAVLFSLFFIIFFFNIHWLYRLLSSIRFLKKFRKFFRIFSRYRKKALLKVFLFSLARFAVFTAQYCLLITLLLPGLPLFPMVMMIFILFFIQSALPSLDLLDIGVRSMTAAYFFSYLTDQEIAIMASTACVWFVNLIIPAVLGSVFVFKLNFFGTDNR